MTFNPAAALEAARLCSRAYSGPNVVQGNAQALVLHSPLRVAIAGTNDRADLREDVAIFCDDLGQGAAAHKGFVQHYRKLIGPLTQMMFAHPFGDDRMSTGHSLGAGCLLLSIYHRPSLFKDSDAYLFGCPEVFDRNGAAIFEMICRDNGITVWNVQGRGDLVATDLTPRKHVGQVVEIGGGWDVASDHAIAAYERDLAAMADRVETRVKEWLALCEPYPPPKDQI